MRLRLLPLLLLPSLAGCALGPRVPTPDTHTPAAFEAPSDVTQGGVPLDRWWSVYNDPQLQSLVDEALQNAPDARTARARLDEAIAVRSEAEDAYNPQGALQGSATESTTPHARQGAVLNLGPLGQIPLTSSGASNQERLNFDVSWEIDIFGRRAAARGKANADLAAARFDYEATRASLAANVADQLFQARGLAIQLDDAQERARIERELARVARAKADHGLGAASDADQADVAARPVGCAGERPGEPVARRPAHPARPRRQGRRPARQPPGGGRGRHAAHGPGHRAGRAPGAGAPTFARRPPSCARRAAS